MFETEHVRNNTHGAIHDGLESVTRKTNPILWLDFKTGSRIEMIVVKVES